MILYFATSAAAQAAREGSGTAWLPDTTPMYMVHVRRGAWMLMGHENAFLEFLSESGNRGDEQTGSINWMMGMAERNVGTSHLALRGMFSLEPWTIRGCGYPDLLASGEQCNGESIHDRQHPHDLLMEISAEYDAPVGGSLRWQVYGGPVGEPALGPVAYPHRVSAMPNPIAPIAHHWLDSTHVSFGVITGGVYGKRWKAESSVFNGREPDQHRTNVDLGALDSISGRVWFMPARNVALQVSGGHLTEAEAGEPDPAFAPDASPATQARRDVNKVTASVTIHGINAGRVTASTVAWGRNAEAGHATNALIMETSTTLNDRDAWFGRAEIAQKTAHDLDVPAARESFLVSKLQGGYTRYASVGAALKAGIGAAASVGIVPGDLKSVYGSRLNPGIAVFLTLRPAMMRVAGDGSGGAQSMVMVQTAYDPAKLTCAAGFDPRSAASAMFEGKTYYFCSPEDRDKFLTDPKMSLSMMPPKQ